MTEELKKLIKKVEKLVDLSQPRIIFMPDKLTIRLEKKGDEYTVSYEEETTYIPKKYAEKFAEATMRTVNLLARENRVTITDKGTMKQESTLNHLDKEGLLLNVASVIFEVVHWLSAQLQWDTLKTLELVYALTKHGILHMELMQHLHNVKIEFKTTWSKELEEKIEEKLKQQEKLIEKIFDEFDKLAEGKEGGKK